MALSLQLFIIGLSLLTLYGVIHFLITQNMSERDSIPWFVIVGICLLLALFPDLLTWLARIIGIDYPPTLLFLVASLILLFISFKCSLDLSKLKEVNRELISQVSLLKSQLQEEDSSVSSDSAKQEILQK